MKKSQLILFILIFASGSTMLSQQISVCINTLDNRRPVSPYLYGKNNSLADKSFGIDDPLTATEWQRLRDMGIQMFRENGGNNASKYNWRKKLSSHPDWYNNVYFHDWDYAAQTLQANIPSAQGMWAFQLIGKAASTGDQNFDDWDYNHSQWWSGCRQNLCGGGTLNPAGGEDALIDGDPGLYLENWNADSTTGILDHWFGTGGIGLNPSKIQYWSMDNEPEIWNGTHDDIWPEPPTAEAFMQQYFEVAKKARTRFPDIKLMGPVPANEWQWYNWNGSKISYNGKEYVWLEYFIMRVAEEQQATGMRLLDVLDIHFYPGDTVTSHIVQLHRVFFDTSYDYPEANGVKRTGSGSWDGTITREYIFKRCNDWLEKYIGVGHGVTLSVSETSIAKRNFPNVTAVWYASTLGEFAKNGVEIFSPWDWLTGMSEVVHLFTHYGQDYFLPAASSDEYTVSAYPTMNFTGDSMTIFLVNRHLTENRTVELTLNDFNILDGSCKVYALSELPGTETFVSHSSNALQLSTPEVQANGLTVTLAPLSVSAVIIKRAYPVVNRFGEMLTSAEAESGILSGVTPSTTVSGYSGTGYVIGFDTAGDKVTLSVNIPSKDVYRLVIRYTSSAKDTFKLSVNNQYLSVINLETTSAFSPADAGGFVLNAGTNTIILSNDSGTAGIDRIEIYPMEKNTFQIAPELTDTAAITEAGMLYAFLQYQFGHRIISGQTNDYFSQLQTIAGKTPLLRAHDFQHYTQGYPYFWKDGSHTFGYDINDHSIDDLISWYNSTGGKGIITMHWHWHDPSGDLNSDAGTNTFYTEYTTFDITKAVIPGTPEYEFVIRDIDSIAFQLKKFQQAGIPVLWRPLHEAGGGWFWWGAKGAEPCLALWDILIERLRNHHQLHNLIWVWSTPEPEWYPGNDKVDIIGYDSYPGNYNYTNQKEMFDNLYTITRGEKMIAMTENGPIPDIDACLAGDAPWLLFMSWSDLVASQNSSAHINEVYNHPDVLTMESDNALTGFEWRSTLYPENWYPGYSDNKGRFLHDFSYAGYQSGIREIPHITGPVIDVTQAPYNADNTGTTDVTSILQQAINNVGNSGGGVVYLPGGIYKISAPESSDFALCIAYDSTIIRGAGMNNTFMVNTSTNMRYKDIIRVTGNYADWFNPVNTPAEIIFDLPESTHVIPVSSTSAFRQDDLIAVVSTPTDAFIAEHKMTGHWTAQSFKGVAFLRRIDTIDTENNLIILDAPTRYPLKTRDQARVYKVDKHISECGIEHLSIGNFENPNAGWDEESYSMAGTGAYETHQSHAIQFRYAENCWIHHVGTFKPIANSGDYHILSNGIKLNQCRFLTIDSCNFEKPQYEGGGGNGYMYTLESNDCLISYSRANHGRHNYDFKYPYSNGNVILRCRGEQSKYASDFHMYLSMANLFDACTYNGDFCESVFRPYGSETSMHGYTSSQSVFYNTTGEAYHPSGNILIDSRQLGWGYIIGTSGAAFEVNVDPAEGITNGILYNTLPVDFVEGTGKGQYLIPTSLYLDQLIRRKSNPTSANRKFRVEIIIKDLASNMPLPDCQVQLYNNTFITDAQGIVVFDDVFEFFTVTVTGDYCKPVLKKQYFVHSDTTLTLNLERETYQVAVKLVRANTTEPIPYTSVNLGELTQVTNTSGEAVFIVTGGTNEYSVTKPLYQPISGSFTVSSDTTLTINLLQILANLRIRLREGTTPINNADVTVNTNTLVSNSLGDALFDQLPVPALYSFYVDKQGYELKAGNVYLTRDTIVLVEMVPEQTDLDPLKAAEVMICWPNPADKLLNISLPEIQGEKTIRIIDAAGIERFRVKTASNQYAADVSGLIPGNFLLKVLCNNDEYIRYFVKK